jgi:hypothetical protein
MEVLETDRSRDVMKKCRQDTYVCECMDRSQIDCSCCLHESTNDKDLSHVDVLVSVVCRFSSNSVLI